MDPIYAKCNKSCGHKFYVSYFKKEQLHKSIEKTYFNCPNCGREYVCFYTDESTRKSQSKMRELHREMKWADGDQMEKLRQEEVYLKDIITHNMVCIRREIES
ncbi:hypothetical protein ACIQZG_07120 [Lysinibacillus sp. NPDC096418]|uniref:hypothetical protein n=1 Tax=Lysinibacillus sp. NPDC096418 TaxID=3364138 RepID=UPI0037FCB8C1